MQLTTTKLKIKLDLDEVGELYQLGIVQETEI